MVDIRSILIRHPEAAIGSECEAFAVNGDAPPTWTGAAEAITCECSHGEDGEAGVCDRTKDVGIKTRYWGTIRTGEENGVLVGDLKIGSRWIGECSVGLWRQDDGEPVDTILVVDSSFRIPKSVLSTPLRSSKRVTFNIPAPVWDSPQHASVAPIL